MAYISFQPNDYFNSLIYTGNNSTNAQTGVGFQPDMVWFKSRSATTDHAIFDAIRGVTKELRPNKTDYEDTASNGLTAFGSDGFTIGDWSVINANSATYVSWNWKANGQGSSNTAGSTNTTYTSASATSGFSMIKYAGTGSNATIGHRLSSAPKMVIVKALTGARDWLVYHKSAGATKYLFTNGSDAQASSSGIWNDTDPTSTLVNLGTSNSVNGSGINYMAYCFAPVKGFSAMGSYIGNGSTTSNFVYCGFKPAFVIVKRIDSSANWVMSDNEISFNGKGTHDSSVLFTSTTAAETDSYGLLLHSNGFNFSGGDSASATVNGDGATYIYIAYASEPLVSSNGVPATAR